MNDHDWVAVLLQLDGCIDFAAVTAELPLRLAFVADHQVIESSCDVFCHFAAKASDDFLKLRTAVPGRCAGKTEHAI